jgi:hypothetical protein
MLDSIPDLSRGPLLIGGGSRWRGSSSCAGVSATVWGRDDVRVPDERGMDLGLALGTSRPASSASSSMMAPRFIAASCACETKRLVSAESGRWIEICDAFQQRNTMGRGTVSYMPRSAPMSGMYRAPVGGCARRRSSRTRGRGGCILP